MNIPTERADAGLGLWLKRQKEKHAVGKLGAKALKRLVAVGVNFDGYHPTSQLELANPGKPKRGRPRKKQNGADTVTPSNAAEAGVSFEVGTESRVDFTVEGALLGASERMKDWRYVLGDEGCEYVYELKRWKQTEGEFIEPPLGSPLAVWLAKQRARAAMADGDEGGSELLTPMPEYEREALVNAGIELENFSPTWLGELEKFHGLRQHRVTLHDPIAQRVFVEEQRQQSAEGKLSRAKLRRLKAAGVSGISGALQLDGVTMDSIDELDDEEFAPWPRGGTFRSEDTEDILQSLMRENVVAAQAAAAARAEAERMKETPKAKKPSSRARARRRPLAPIAPGPVGVQKEEEEEGDEEEVAAPADSSGEFERART